MTHDNLNRLRRIFWQKWEDMPEWSNDDGDPLLRRKVQEQWDSMCCQVGCRQDPMDRELQGPYDHHRDGEILEDYIVIPNPSRRPFWLIMTHEAAMKILILGFV